MCFEYFHPIYKLDSSPLHPQCGFHIQLIEKLLDHLTNKNSFHLILFNLIPFSIEKDFC